MLEFPIDTNRFLRQHWQKSPCLIKIDLGDWQNPYSAEELAGLACEDGIEARLVSEHHQDPQWRVRHGPFDDQDFLALTDSHWTLLVQDMDKHDVEVADLLKHFQFLPNWRFDDIMISYAADQGSVGPHWDEYDVFLLQVIGERHWRIDTTSDTETNHIDGLDLRIMEHFETSHEWTLKPGQMLYLPPKVGHHGTAVGNCMTYSVGFRAPSGSELAEGVFARLSEQGQNRHERFADPSRTPTNHPNEISSADLEQLCHSTLAALSTDTDSIKQMLLELLTEPKPGLEPEPASSVDGDSDRLIRNPASRLLCTTLDGTKIIACGGLSCRLGDSDGLYELLNKAEPITSAELYASCSSPLSKSFLEDLIREGHLRCPK